MAQFVESSHHFVLPFVEEIHGAILAYCRTSEFGPWTIDAERPSDAFAMNFVRGRWGKGWLGGRYTPLPSIQL